MDVTSSVGEGLSARTGMWGCGSAQACVLWHVTHLVWAEATVLKPEAMHIAKRTLSKWPTVVNTLRSNED